LPSGFGTPHYIYSSQSKIEIGWQTPNQQGGCPVIEYKVFLDETEVASFNSANVFTHSLDMSAGVIGQIYKVKVQATNYAGSVQTNSLSVALASLPQKPSVSPISEASLTSPTTLAVVIELFSATNDGGSEITLYEIQLDDGRRG
jgi:hypothetical protein